MIKRKKSLTCLAAIKHRGKIYMAADRRTSWDMSQAQEMPRPKIKKRDGVILAGTGDGYLCTLIVDIMKIPIGEGQDLDIYMHWTFHQAVTKLLLAKGYADEHKQLKIPPSGGAEILVAIQGMLYTVLIDNPDAENLDNPFGLVSIEEVNFPYASGCGGHLAWGSLLTTETLDMKPKDRLKLALQVAAKVSPGCDAVVDIEHE